MKNSNDKNEKHTKTRIIICTIIIIIIILLLITSCTSGFWGRVGKLFNGATNYIFNHGSANKVVIKNKDLKFITFDGEMNLDDGVYKINFETGELVIKKLTCTTSDEDIASCKVKEDYVEVTPKEAGKVIIYINTESNGKKYEGTHNLTINPAKKGIELSKNSGNLYLSKGNTINIPYYLKNIKGDISVSVSDNDIATATISNRVLKVVAKKTGKVTVTITVDDNGKKYTATYKLNVYEKPPVTTTKPTTSTTTTTTTSTTTSTTKTKPTKTSSTTSTTKTSTTKPGSNTTISTTTSTTTTTTSTTKPTGPTVSGENRLSSITVISASLSPSFNKDTYNYQVNVDANTNKLTLTATKLESHETLEYYVDGIKVSSLNNINIHSGTTRVEVKVKAENGSTKTYVVEIIKAKSANNDLASLSTSVGTLTPSFNKDTTNYTVDVLYNTPNIKITSTLSDSRSNVKYKVNNVIVNDLNKVNLSEGNTDVEIIVTSESNEEKIYKITIHKPVRKIEFASSNFEEYIEESPFRIAYTVYEDDIEIHSYNLNEIDLAIANFKGTFKKYQDYIEIIPNDQDINNTYTVKLKHINSEATLTLKVKIKDYYVKVLSNKYDIDVLDGIGTKNIIFDTNSISSSITASNITNGIVLSSNKTKINITTNNSKVKLSYIPSDNIGAVRYYSLHVEIPDDIDLTNDVYIYINSSVYGIANTPAQIKLNITKKYKLVLDALDGFYDSFTSVYEYIYPDGKEIDLNEYIAYLEATGDCEYYVLEKYTTNEDGTGDEYIKPATGDWILTLHKNLTLYAQYKNVAEEVILSESGIMYLTDVDIFKNDDYYNKYNIEKMIYPGVEGNFLINITNNSTSDIKITKVNIEEDTICSSLNKGKCLNMGYILKYEDPTNPTRFKYVYGGNNLFKIVNKDDDTTLGTGVLTGYHTERNITLTGDDVITITSDKTNKNNEFELYLLWKWVDSSNDTEIGVLANDSNKYHLTLSFAYEKSSTHCSK